MATIEEYEWKFPYKKIKIPFRERRDRVKWPDNKILAVDIHFAQEWWGREFLPGSNKVLDIGNLSYLQDYNFDIGVWRVLQMLDRYELKGAFGTSGAGAKHHPDVIREITKRGHEIHAHGYYQSRFMPMLTPDEEREDIAKTTAILESVSGKRPLGWGGPAASCSERTFEFIIEQGYIYNNDLRDDDLPYGIKVKDKILIEIPHRTQTTNDYSWFSGTLGILSPVKAQRSPREAVEFFQDTFDGYYETAKREGAILLSFGIHPFMSCTPDRIGAIERMIAYMRGFPDIWFTTWDVLAQFWKENYV